MSQKTEFPRGWDEERVRRVLEHYESQSESAAVAEDEAAYEDPNQVFMEVPAVADPLLDGDMLLLATEDEAGTIMVKRHRLVLPREEGQ